MIGESASNNNTPEKQKRIVRSDRSWRRSNDVDDKPSFSNSMNASFGWALDGLVGDFHWRKYTPSAILLEKEANNKKSLTNESGMTDHEMRFESVADKILEQEEKISSMGDDFDDQKLRNGNLNGKHRKANGFQTLTYEPYELCETELSQVYRGLFNSEDSRYDDSGSFVFENILTNDSLDSPKCSLLETSCNMISLITGSGMLSLPYAGSIMGWSSVFVLLALSSCYIYAFYLVGLSIEYFLESANLSYIRETVNRGHYGALNTSEYSFRDSDKFIQRRKQLQSVDYLALGKASFGQLGGRLVAVCLFTELLLALTSFFINIGINLTVMNQHIDSKLGILIAGIISLMLSFMKMKFAVYSSALGILMTSLILVSLIISGWALSYSQHSTTTASNYIDVREYKFLKLEGLPMSLGLISFCFGGHGA